MPEIIEAIEIPLENDTAGDPNTGLKWTRKTTKKIAEVLQEITDQLVCHPCLTGHVVAAKAPEQALPDPAI